MNTTFQYHGLDNLEARKEELVISVCSESSAILREKRSNLICGHETVPIDKDCVLIYCVNT